jgi:hypothetical protein
MKIKQQQNSNDSPVHQPGASGDHSLTGATAAAVAASLDDDSQHAQSQSPTILTRSAAFRAAANKHKPLTCGTSHHKQHHVIGKIVKPIPVRPVSSSASSTHSSSFSSTHHQHHHNHSMASFISNSMLSMSQTGQTQPAPQTSGTSSESAVNSNSSNEFSLIAKYFASFPATRLKSSNLSESINNSNTNPVGYSSNSSSPVMLPPFATTTGQPTEPVEHSNQSSKRTPFLPFKKPLPVSAASSHQHAPLTTATSHSHGYASDLGAVGGIGCVSSTLVPIDLGTSRNLNPYNLRHYHQNNHGNQSTDHLCTNFKRMIKLNDHTHAAHEDLSPASPCNVAANSAINLPTGLNDHNEKESSDSRLGQITMETRSTRKFLIKHHPYLQFNQNHNTSTVYPLQSLSQQQQHQQPRPSMNLIKMKKMISKANRKLAKQLEHKSSMHQQEQKRNYDSPLSFCATAATSTHISGLNSANQTDCQMTGCNEDYYSNQHHHHHHHHQKLLKFTDMAPQPSIVNSLRNAKQRSSSKLQLQSSVSRLSTSTSTASFQRPLPASTVASNPNMRTTRTR